MLKASDVMVRNVISVGPETDVTEAMKILAERDISALPVLDEAGKLVGLVSEADLMRRASLGTEKHRPWLVEAVTPSSILAEEYAKSHGRRVAEVMTQDVVTVTAETPVSEIANILERHRIKRVPVVADGKVIGIVSRSNLIQALASGSAVTSASSETDRALRDKILVRLSDQSWTHFGEPNVVVRDGVVHLWGLVGTPEEHKALLALAEDAGAARVDDDMIPSYA